MTKILIAGTFDLLHPGHINLIKQAQQLGNFLVIVVARDQTVLKVKGRAPYFNEKQRLENLNALLNSKFEALNPKQIQITKTQNIKPFQIILGDLLNPYKIIGEEKPDIIALGYDQQNFVAGLKQWIQDTSSKLQDTRLQPFKEDICKGKNVRKAIEDSQSSFLLIDKPSDWTSHDVVAKLRSITGIKQIGHTGTLDPFATGLLICAVGQATKMVGLFDVLPKTYEATIKLGVTSDTYDRTGQISNYQCPISNQFSISNLQLQTVLNSFIGKQQQLPPMFSAKKVQGKKLYELARQGQIIERKPSEIEIYNISLMNEERSTKNDVAHHSSFLIQVTCSAGTYIRTLAHDIGQKLGTGAILEELKRTAIGEFDLSQAVQLSQLTKDNYSKYLVRPLEALAKINSCYIKKTP